MKTTCLFGATPSFSGKLFVLENTECPHSYVRPCKLMHAIMAELDIYREQLILIKQMIPSVSARQTTFLLRSLHSFQKLPINPTRGQSQRNKQGSGLTNFLKRDS
ncbi:hypothetical protein Mapa_004354 [Marchantia paleacea]|nr:hypothetical protein Mapa_004354 [Marchantia paleacea]